MCYSSLVCAHFNRQSFYKVSLSNYLMSRLPSWMGVFAAIVSPAFHCLIVSLFGCRVFYKVKSRSAHMKSHSVLAKKAREAVAKNPKHPS